MRIISGTFRGKKILEPKDKKTRPLKDLTKESIFNIIIHSKHFDINFSEANVLDLFSGVGSFGLECLSRGVKNVTFVENYSVVLEILKKNLSNLSLIHNFEIIEKNIYEDNLEFNLKKKFDIIFLDPPYKDKNTTELLIKIDTSKVVNKSGIIILHRHKNDNDIIPSNFKIIEEKRYGISKIYFLSILD